MSVQSERAEQTQLVAWAESTGDSRLAWLHSSLNGETLTAGQARNARRAGMKAGIPDLFLPVPSVEAHGLFIEMKTKTGRLSQDQVKCHAFLSDQGYEVVVARSWWEAKAAIIKYLRGGVE